MINDQLKSTQRVIVNANDVKSWPAQTLVLEVWHELNQKSALAMSFMHVLLDEDIYGFANAEQRNTLVQLQQEIEIIREITELMGEWISENKGKTTSTGC
jgi:hypothetical protein